MLQKWLRFLKSVQLYYFSNFWGGLDGYYYTRTEEYKEILEFKKTGCFPVPLIHTAVLIDIRNKNQAGYSRLNDSIPEDDIILLAMNAQAKDIPMEICNDLEYGYILSPLDDEIHINSDIPRLQNLRVEMAGEYNNIIKLN